MTDRRDDLKRILAEGMEREAGLKNTLRRVMDRYPDATAAEIADALRPVTEQARDVERTRRASRQGTDTTDPLP
jgi:hypothetical protein